MQARYYDPVIGRFYSNDPVDVIGHLNRDSVQGFNRYTYAYNNPYKYTDPNGEIAVVAVWIARGLYVGGKFAYKAYKAKKQQRKISKAVYVQRQAEIATQVGELTYANRPNGMRDHKVPGGVIGAILHEAATGEDVGGKNHLEKGSKILKRLNKIEKLIKRSRSLTGKDRRKLLRQLRKVRDPLRDAVEKARKARDN